MTPLEESHLRAAIAERERTLAAALLGQPRQYVPWQLDDLRAGIERLRKELGPIPTRMTHERTT